jgi:DNA gyrase/topoisomerase IV subunit A
MVRGDAEFRMLRAPTASPTARHDACMDEEQREAARARLALLELMVAAQERRHEVVDVIWGSSTEAEALKRLRELLDLEDGAPVRLVLDMQMHRRTGDARSRVASDIEELRKSLS